MGVRQIIELFKAAKSNEKLKSKILDSPSEEDFIKMASDEGYLFNIEELNLILKIVRKTSLNPCSIEQVDDDSSDYLEEFKATDSDSLIVKPSPNNISELENISFAEKDDTDDAGSSRIESLSLRENIKRFTRSSLKINIVLSESNSTIMGSKSTLDTTETIKKLLAFRVNMDLSEQNLLSWTEKLAEITSILEK